MVNNPNNVCHCGGYKWQGSFECAKCRSSHPPPDKKCLDCQKPVTKYSSRCMSCAQKHRFKDPVVMGLKTSLGYMDRRAEFERNGIPREVRPRMWKCTIKEINELLAEGYNVQKIARKLHVSKNSIYHKINLYKDIQMVLDSKSRVSTMYDQYRQEGLL